MTTEEKISKVKESIKAMKEIEKLEKEGARLHRFKGARDGMKNRVSLIWIRKKPLTRAVLELKDFLIKEIKS